MGTACLSSLLYTIFIVPAEAMSILRKLRNQKYIMKCTDVAPDWLLLWAASVWEMFTGSAMYTCALYSLPFCLSSNRSMILTNFAVRLKVIMLGNVLCTMCIVLVALASTIFTMALVDKQYREHSVYFGFFLYVFATIISGLLMVVFLVSRVVYFQ